METGIREKETKKLVLRANGPTERREENNAGKNKCLRTEEKCFYKRELVESNVNGRSTNLRHETKSGTSFREFRSHDKGEGLDYQG